MPAKGWVSTLGDGWRLALLLVVPALSIWHLELLPALYFAWLALTDAERESLSESPRRTGARAPLEALAIQFLLYCALAAGVSVATARHPVHVALWWVALDLLLLALRQIPAEDPTDVVDHVIIEVRKNLFELLVIAGVVLGLGCLVQWRYELTPLPETTLAELLALEHHIEVVHDTLEVYKPAIKTLALLSVLFLVARVLCARFPAFRAPTKVGAIAVVWSLSWLGRLSTAFALAAALTFLATGPAGPVAQVRITLRDALDEYNNLQSKLAEAAEPAAREALLQRFWNERPTELKVAITEALEFEKVRGAYEEESQRLGQVDVRGEEARRGVPSPLDRPLPDRPPPPKPALVTSITELDSSWSLDKLRAASQAILPQLSRENWKPETNVTPEDPLPELITELASHVDFVRADRNLKLFKDHYPVIGEFFDAISTAAMKAGFNFLRDRTAKRVASVCAGQGCGDIASLTKKEAWAQMAAVPLSWSFFDSAWHRDVRSQLAAYTSALLGAQVDLEPRALEVRRKAISLAKDELENAVRQLEAMAGTPDFAELKDKARLARESTAALTSLGAAWPGRNAPSQAQLSALANLDEAAASFDPYSLRLGDSPEHVMNFLAAGCRRLVGQAVAQSRWTSRATELANAIGVSEYRRYIGDLDDTAAREAAEKKAAEIERANAEYARKKAAEEVAARAKAEEFAERAK